MSSRAETVIILHDTEPEFTLSVKVGRGGGSGLGWEGGGGGGGERMEGELMYLSRHEIFVNKP
jgi:hypothetical protein